MIFRSKLRLPGWLLLVATMTALGPMSIDMYLPGFPAIERELQVRGVESTMAAYLIGIAVGQLFYGPLSDHFGRKPPLYFGLALYTIGALGCAVSNSLTMLICMRVVQALGGCAGLVIGRAIVRDRCEPHEAARAFSTLMMIFALGPIIAPALGGIIVTAFGWRETFIVQAALGFIVLIAMHRVLSESRSRNRGPPPRIADVLRGYGRLLADRSFVGYAFTGGFGTGALFSYVTGAPIVLTQRFDLSPQQFGWLIGLNGVAFMLASRLNIIALRTMGPGEALARHVWQPVLLGAALFALAIAWSPPLWVVVALQLAIFVSVGRVNPNVAALALGPYAREAGAASALMGALQSTASTTAGLAVALLNDGSVATLAAIMTVGAGLSLASYAWVRSAAAQK